MKRLFFAVWPDDNSRVRVNRLNQRIEQKGIRRLVPANLHITLLFLGNVDDDIAHAVQKQAAAIQAPSFSLLFDELDYWPRPRVLCLTCRRQPKPLYELVNQLRGMVSAFPVRLDQRAYRAHITMARKAKQRPQLLFDPILIKANRFALVESCSTEQGVRYRVIDSWPLSPVL